MGKESFDLKTAVEQIIGREGETATFFSRCLLTLCLSVAVLRHVISAVRWLTLC